MKNVPICVENEEKPENFKKIPINTHVLKKKQESGYKNQDKNKLKLLTYPPPAITTFSFLSPT